ncbi:MAG TPA: hypothetical protein VHM48_04075 [Candidatus Limnocylindrales bacterium]|nr:hypothetical protein [Candidatus Limnocylindrales bacterium]
MAARHRRPAGLRRTLALVVGLVALFSHWSPAPANAAPTWTLNLYTSSAFVYQDPYPTACTAAATMIMLNAIAYRHTGGNAFRWTASRVKNDANTSNTHDMTSILWFERSHDTLSARGYGSDGHGWRNALNAYGWGSAAMTDPTQWVYDDLGFTSYDAAVHAAVRAIAQYRMPVGILAWAGGHAQVMTGYVVDGDDPALSDAFTVRYIYLSDPLYKDHFVNTKVSNATFKSGTWRIRFQAYRETDSPYDDPYKSGWKRSSVSPAYGPSEWYHRWVIVAPIRLPAGVPDPTPTPTPPPNPTPTPDPTATPAPTATPSPVAPEQAGPSDSPSPVAPSEEAPAASPSPTV